MDKQKILEKINFADFYKERVQKFYTNGNGQGKCCCPFHPDENPSFSINLETGQYFCHVCNDGGDLIKFHMKRERVSFKEALSQLSKYSGHSGEKVISKIECAYPYLDESGNLLFEVVRYTPKTFRQRRSDGKGGYIYNLNGVRLVPYNLPKVITSDTVSICEGEKDCDNLAKLSLTATTNPMGAGKWRDEFGQYFTGKDIVIFCDNDEVGKKHGHDVARKLSGYAKTIKVIEQLPGVPAKGDVSDWLKVSGDDRAKLMEFVENVPLWTPKESEKNASAMVLTSLSSLLQEPEETTTWLVEGLLPSGGFSVCVAKPKVGKSTFARTLALYVARGGCFLGRAVAKGVVIYLALEEKRSEIKRHFKEMGAIGEEEIHIYTGGTPIDAIKQIKEATERLKPVLVIIDPLFRLTRVKDGNDYIQVTNALDPLLRLARDTGSHVLCVHHANKMDGQDGSCVLGSTAIFGSVDTLLIMRRHEHYRTLETIQRYGDDLPKTILSFNKTTRTLTLDGTCQDFEVNILKGAIIDFLKNQTEPVTEAVIMNEIEGKTGNKRKSLREMIGKEIKRDGKGGKGDPYKYSCFLVPGICREQGNENQKTTGNQHGCEDYSRSLDFGNFGESEKSRELESLKENEYKNGNQKSDDTKPIEEIVGKEISKSNLEIIEI